jgi:hypothetical protein
VPAEMDSERYISTAQLFGYPKNKKEDKNRDDCEKEPKKKCCNKYIDEQIVQASNLQKFAWEFGTGKVARAFYNGAFEAWKKFIKNTAKEPCACDCHDGDCHDDDCHDDDDEHEDGYDCDDKKHHKDVAIIVENKDLKFTCDKFK